MAIKASTCLSVIVVIALAGCRPKTLEPASYVRFLQEKGNGFRKETTVGDWTYKLQYKPPAYIYLQENGGKAVTEEDFEQRKQTLKGWLFFNLYVSHKTTHKMSPLRIISRDMTEYNAYLSYYLSENKMNFKLFTPTDTLSPSVYVFENNYNLSPEDVFVVGFQLSKDWKPSDITVSYNDEILKTGIIKFSFAGEELTKEPTVVF